MKYKILLTLIFLLALVLRFYKLSEFRCLNWDEAAFGYNAYSILTTGKDEYGVTLPLQFKSVGDYKAPLYIYLTVPVIKIFGLNAFSVRLLPSLLGSLSILVIYFIVNYLTKRKSVAIVSAFLLAVSPWHLQFVRGGVDFGISNFFVNLGILGFLLGVKGRRLGFILSFLSFTASIFAYFADRLFSPLMLVLLIITFRKEILIKRRLFLKSLVIGLLVVLPIIPSLISGGHIEKILKTTVFGYTRPADYVQQINSEDPSRVLYFLFHTDYFETVWGIINKYLNHFSPTFLFTQGAVMDPRQLIYGMGLMYLIELPFLLVGLYYLIKNKDRVKILILGWLILAPIPAAITRDLVSARRTLNMPVILLIITSLGFIYVYNIWNKWDRKILRLIVGASFVLISVYQIFFYLFSYYIFTTNRTIKGPAGWQCGYKELVNYIDSVEMNYQRIIVDTAYQGPYIFFLFYEKYPPINYQSQAKLIQSSPDSLGEGQGYDKYEFRPIYWPKDRCLKDVLFAGTFDSLPMKDIKEGEAEVVNTIYFQNGDVAFRLVKVVNPDSFHCKEINQETDISKFTAS